jgi:hypothetical protein
MFFSLFLVVCNLIQLFDNIIINLLLTFTPVSMAVAEAAESVIPLSDEKVEI